MNYQRGCEQVGTLTMKFILPSKAQVIIRSWITLHNMTKLRTLLYNLQIFKHIQRTNANSLFKNILKRKRVPAKQLCLLRTSFFKMHADAIAVGHVTDLSLADVPVYPMHFSFILAYKYILSFRIHEIVVVN